MRETNRPANQHERIQLASDLALKAEVSSALKSAHGIIAARITATVLDGHVVLLGVVSDEEERRLAAAVVTESMA